MPVPNQSKAMRPLADGCEIRSPGTVFRAAFRLPLTRIHFPQRDGRSNYPAWPQWIVLVLAKMRTILEPNPVPGESHAAIAFGLVADIFD